MSKWVAVPVLAIASILAVHAFATAPAAAPAARPIEFTSLEDSLAPLQGAFNQAQGKPRILALVSAT